MYFRLILFLPLVEQTMTAIKDGVVREGGGRVVNCGCRSDELERQTEPAFVSGERRKVRGITQKNKTLGWGRMGTAIRQCG